MVCHRAIAHTSHATRPPWCAVMLTDDDPRERIVGRLRAALLQRVKVPLR
jgi:hypothetical protein